jgi:hypothetical protein
MGLGLPRRLTCEGSWNGAGILSPLSLFFLWTFFIHRFLPFLVNLGLCPDLASFEDGFGGAFAEQPRTTYRSSLKDFFNLGCRLF